MRPDTTSKHPIHSTVNSNRKKSTQLHIGNQYLEELNQRLRYEQQDAEERMRMNEELLGLGLDMSVIDMNEISHYPIETYPDSAFVQDPDSELDYILYDGVAEACAKYAGAAISVAGCIATVQNLLFMMN